MRRIGSILNNVNGVISFNRVGPNLINVRFDDEKTDPGIISKALRDGRMPIQGEPNFID